MTVRTIASAKTLAIIAAILLLRDDGLYDEDAAVQEAADLIAAAEKFEEASARADAKEDEGSEQ